MKTILPILLVASMQCCLPLGWQHCIKELQVSYMMEAMDTCMDRMSISACYTKFSKLQCGDTTIEEKWGLHV